MQNTRTYDVGGAGIPDGLTNTVTYDYTGLDKTTVRLLCGPYEGNDIIRLQGIDRRVYRSGKQFSPHTIVVRDTVSGVRRSNTTVVVREMTDEEMLAKLKASGKLNDEMIAVITGSAE